MHSRKFLPELESVGHVFVESAEMLGWLAEHGPLDDWDAFRASWDGMPLDTYMADGGRYRRRRHAVFSASGGGIVREPERPHFQSRDYNPLNGDVARHFEPIPAGLGAGPSAQAILRSCHDCFGTLDPEVARWDIEVHQFRIEAVAGQSGEPTPEGVHRDGVDWVLVLLLRRDNIASGTTTIYQPDGAPRGSFTLTHVGDAVLLDDERVFHGVTAVSPIRADEDAFRDVLVVTFRRA